MTVWVSIRLLEGTYASCHIRLNSAIKQISPPMSGNIFVALLAWFLFYTYFNLMASELIKLLPNLIRKPNMYRCSRLRISNPALTNLRTLCHPIQWCGGLTQLCSSSARLLRRTSSWILTSSRTLGVTHIQYLTLAGSCWIGKGNTLPLREKTVPYYSESEKSGFT